MVLIFTRIFFTIFVVHLCKGYDYEVDGDDFKLLVKRQANYDYGIFETTQETTTKRIIRSM